MKRILFIFFIGFTLTISTANVFAQDFVEISAKVANIRAAPSIKSSILGKVVQGNKFKVIKIEGGWYQIAYKTIRAWVHYSTIKENKDFTALNNLIEDSKKDGDFTNFVEQSQKEAAAEKKRNAGLDAFLDEKNSSDWLLISSLKTENAYLSQSRIVRSNGTVKFWIKYTNKSSKSPKSMSRYEIDCSSSTVRILSNTDYTADGSVLESQEVGGMNWTSIYPESSGETMQNKVCSTIK